MTVTGGASVAQVRAVRDPDLSIPKLIVRDRFPSPAPTWNSRSETYAGSCTRHAAAP